MPNNLVIPSSSSNKSSLRTSSSKIMRSRQSNSPNLSFTPALATLTFGKASRVFAAFVSFHYLQDRVALPLYLFFVTFGAAITLLLLQRPWRGKRIGNKRFKKILLAGGLLVITLYIWTAGLRSAGPLRTLLVDGAELPLLYLFAVLTRRELPEKRKTRGAIFMLLAYILLIWDASGHVPDVNEIENSKFGQKAGIMVDRFRRHGHNNNHHHQYKKNLHNIDNDNDNDNDDDGGGGGGDGLSAGLIEEGMDGNNHQHEKGGNKRSGRRLLTTFRPRVKGPGGVKDAFVEGTALRCEIGVILVLLASMLVQAGRGFSRRLATELGGAKRHFALSMSAGVIWVTPLALVSWLSSSTGSILSLQMIGGITKISITTSHVIGFVGVGFLWLVLPYYARAIVSTAISNKTMMQSAVVTPFVMAVVVSELFGGAKSAGGLSWVLFAAFTLECIGVSLMMAGGIKNRGLSELPIDSSGTTSTTRLGVGRGVGGGMNGTQEKTSGSNNISNDSNNHDGDINGSLTSGVVDDKR